MVEDVYCLDATSFRAGLSVFCTVSPLEIWYRYHIHSKKCYAVRRATEAAPRIETGDPLERWISTSVGRTTS